MSHGGSGSWIPKQWFEASRATLHVGLCKISSDFSVCLHRERGVESARWDALHTLVLRVGNETAFLRRERLITVMMKCL